MRLTRHRREALAAAAFMTAVALGYLGAVIRLRHFRDSDWPLLVFVLLCLPIAALFVNAFLSKGSGLRVLCLALGTIFGLVIATMSGPCWSEFYEPWAPTYRADCFIWVAGCTFAFTFVGARAVGSRQMSALHSAIILIGLVAVLLLFSFCWLPQLFKAY